MTAKRAIALGLLLLVAVGVWAAIDSAAKRASAVALSTPSTVLVVPDGTISAADRQTITGLYGGIAAGAVDITAPSGYAVSIDQASITAANDDALSFTFADAETSTTYDYSISNGGTSVTGTGSVTTATQQITGIDVTSLPDGTLTLSVTLTDGSGNVGTAATDTVSKDATGPVFVSAAVPEAGTSLVVTFDEATTQGASYADSDWTVTASGGAVTLTYASGDTTTAHTFTTSRTIDQDETLTLAWAGTANGLEDASGNDLASFSAESVTNSSTQDLVAPTIESASINGAVLTWTLSETIFSGAGGTGGATLTCDGGAVTATYDSISSSRILFDLSREPANDETCTTAYTQPGNGFEDGAGNDLATFADQSVTFGGDLQHRDPTLRHNDPTLRHQDTDKRHKRSDLRHQGASVTTELPPLAEVIPLPFRHWRIAACAANQEIARAV